MSTMTEEKEDVKKRLRVGGRRITLKFAGVCADCATELPAGTTARWYGRGRIYGLDCHAQQVRTEEPGGAVTYSPPPINVLNISGKLHDLGDGLTDKIEALFADRRQNTPKQQQQAGYARLSGIHLKRTQEALYALSSLYEAGEVPIILQGFTTKTKIHEAMKSKMDGGNHGYYSVPVDLGIPASDAPEVAALWAVIEGQTPAEKEAEELTRKVNGLKFSNIPGYFPTPQPIIDLMIQEGDIYSSHTILEPSAGHGAIMDAVRPLCHSVEGLEVNYTLAEIIKAKGHTVTQADFMDWGYLDQNFDRVLMNPPFEKSQDIDHVMRAFALALAPGGRLVSIMSAGAFQRTDSKAQGFRHWIGELGACIHDLPEDSFKESGTGVSSKMIVIDKPF